MQPNFNRAQQEATKLLLKQSINNLRIDVRNFKFDKNIVIDSIQNYAKQVNRPISSFICAEFNGCCVLKSIDNNLNIILYDEREKNNERLHWGIVHEVGHIYLGHKKDDSTEEIEAHYFAAQIVTPEIALIYISKYKKQSISATDISSVFNCSLTSAEKRIKTLSTNIWSFTENDKKLLQKFKPLIDKQFKIAV